MDQWLLAQVGVVVYIALFVLLLGGAIGLPIPEDLPLILGGILASRGQGRPEIILLVCYIAIVLGDVLIFFIGRYFGAALFKKAWFRSRFSPAKLREVRKRLERRRFVTIFVARHLFYLRTLTFLTCGAVKMRFSLFIVADALAALISAPLMFGLGYLLAENYESLLDGIREAKLISLALGLIAILAVCALLFHRHRTHAAQAALSITSNTEGSIKPD